MDDATRTELEAAAFRALRDHLRARTDVQNIDLMNLAGFCRNCLSRWYQEAAAARGIAIGKEEAREIVYGMPYDEWVARHQTEAVAGGARGLRDAAARELSGRAARRAQSGRRRSVSLPRPVSRTESALIAATCTPWTRSPACTRSMLPLGSRTRAWRPSAPAKTPTSETLPRERPTGWVAGFAFDRLRGDDRGHRWHRLRRRAAHLLGGLDARGRPSRARAWPPPSAAPGRAARRRLPRRGVAEATTTWRCGAACCTGGCTGHRLRGGGTTGFGRTAVTARACRREAGFAGTALGAAAGGRRLGHGGGDRGGGRGGDARLR